MLRCRISYALAAASGVLLALSFPKFGFPALGWIALAPLLVALAGEKRVGISRAFALGLTTGVIYFGGTLYWITGVMVVYGGLSRPVAVLVNVLLIAFLALYPALFALILRRLVAAFGPGALMTAPLVWVATELGRTHLFTGFPWVLLGYSQTPVLPIAQLASVVGVFGVSALVASVSAAFALVAVSQKGYGPFSAKKGYDPFSKVAIGSVAALLVIVAVWGARRAARAEWTRDGDPIRVALIQGDVNQEEKWSPERAASIFQEYIQMTRQAIGAGAQFVVWPESSTPFYFEEDPAGAAQIRTLARQARVPILVGSDQIVHGAPTKYYNAAFLVRADGSTGGVYRKMHLVPFGEYVPMKTLLFFASPLVEQVSDYSAGTDAALLPVRGHLVSTAICYEIVYPDLVRRFVRGGSELLTTITNDAWFGRTSAPYQHFEQAAMRAIEEGRYLVRSANTGVSGVVDPYGRVLAESAIFQRVVLLGDARFLHVTTIYARIGDAFAYASAVITILFLVAARRRVQ